MHWANMRSKVDLDWGSINVSVLMYRNPDLMTTTQMDSSRPGPDSKPKYSNALCIVNYINGLIYNLARLKTQVFYSIVYY